MSGGTMGGSDGTGAKARRTRGGGGMRGNGGGGRFSAYVLRVAGAFQAMRMRGQLLCVLEIFVGYLSPLVGVIVAIVLKAMRKDEVWRFFPLAGAVLAMAVFTVSYLVSIATA